MTLGVKDFFARHPYVAFGSQMGDRAYFVHPSQAIITAVDRGWRGVACRDWSDTLTGQALQDAYEIAAKRHLKPPEVME